MNKSQARRLTLWANGCWLLMTDTTGLDELQSDVGDDKRLQRARENIAFDMIQKSGIPSNASLSDAKAIVGIK